MANRTAVTGKTFMIARIVAAPDRIATRKRGAQQATAPFPFYLRQTEARSPLQSHHFGYSCVMFLLSYHLW